MNKIDWAETLSTHPILQELETKCRQIRRLFPQDHITTPIPKEYTLRRIKAFATDILKDHKLGRIDIKSALPGRNKLEYRKDMCFDTLVVVTLSEEYELEDVLIITQGQFLRLPKYPETARQSAALKFAQQARLHLSENYSLYNNANNCVTLREDLACKS